MSGSKTTKEFAIVASFSSQMKLADRKYDNHDKALLAALEALQDGEFITSQYLFYMNRKIFSHLKTTKNPHRGPVQQSGGVSPTS